MKIKGAVLQQVARESESFDPLIPLSTSSWTLPMPRLAGRVEGRCDRYLATGTNDSGQGSAERG
jgi:hypothetical protein